MKEKSKIIGIRTVYPLLILVLTLLFTSVYTSMALFQRTVEKAGIAVLKASNVNIKLTTNESDFIIASNNDYGTITVEPTSNKEFNITVQNETTGNIKYKVWHKSNVTSNVEVGVSTESLNPASDVLNSKEKKTITIVIKNNSNQSVITQVGVQTGYENNNIILDNGRTESPTIQGKNRENAPVLAEGMIPVIYNESTDNWVKASIDNWYDYSNQQWANAVTVTENSRDTYKNAEVLTEIKMSDINAMWVWIPRYKYKIPSHIGSATNISTPPQIDIEFEKETSTTGVSETVYRNGITDNGENSNYYTHPAFTFGSEELTGFWVGKFETGGTSDSPYILPTINPIVNLNVKDQFLTSLKFTGGTMNNSTGVVTFSGNDTYGLTGNVNSHSMKNTEWGAVAYLALSQYGKSGNDTYTGEDKEVYINNLQYTGLSGGSPNASINAQHYSYNDITCSTTSCDGSKVLNKGRGASTTGTIYGVYDMSGGVWENTMANYNQQTSFSGFTVFPETKYYDLYIGSNNNDVTKDKAILGDATWETIHWYSDISYLVNSNSAWLLRGGYNDYDKLAGVSCAYVSTGQAHESIGFRTVLTL